MITGAADPRALDGQLRSREEALRQVTRDEAAVVLACERLDHARHALGLLHVLAARLAALEADRTDAAVAREARRCARFARAADGAQLRLNPKLAAAFCHRLAALACGEGGAVARVAAAALAAVAPALAPAPGCLTPAHADCLQCCLAGRDYARGRRFLGAAPVARPAARAAPAAPAVATSHLLAVGFDGDQLDRILYGGAPLVKTRADGKLVCRVSARMFPDRAALRKHVAKSKLYRAAYEKACREGRISLA